MGSPAWWRRWRASSFRRSPPWGRRWPRRSSSKPSRSRSWPGSNPVSGWWSSACSSAPWKASPAISSAAAGARSPGCSSSSSLSPCAPPGSSARRSSERSDGSPRIMWKRLLLIRGAELLMFAVLAAVPLAVHNPYALGLLTLLAIYGILLIGLDVSVGYLGQVNLAQAAFLGLGAYTAGLCVARLGWGMPLATLAAIVVGVLLGALLALPALRLEGPQFALATLSFTALNVTVLNESEWLTGGAQGLSFTRPPLLGHALTPPEFYWLCMALFALVWLAMRNLLASQWGRAFEALRDSP